MLEQRERRRFTPEEYLLIEERSDYKSEYYDGEIFSMTGGSLNHNRIIMNLIEVLRRALAGTPCEVFSSDVRLLVEHYTLFTYPDILVVCGEPRLMPNRTDTLTDATLIIEVLSPSTKNYDRVYKAQFYHALPSLQEYLTVAQDEARVERHLRKGEHDWLVSEIIGLERELELESVGASIPLKSVYQRVLS